MKISINYPQLAAEFVIVFVGVAVALAADEWRQNLNERSEESIYISRLARDLELGEQQIHRMLDVFSRVSQAAIELSEILEAEGPYDNADEILKIMLQTGRLGASVTGLSHDVTYRELISNGGLRIISNLDLRESLDDYFLAVTSAQLNRERVDSSISKRVVELTGRPAYVFDNEFDQQSDEAKTRLMNEIVKNPETKVILRRITSQSYQTTLFLNRALEKNLQLQSRLR